MSQKRSPLWVYFDVSATDNSQAKCKLCKPPILVFRGNVNPSKMTTKNLHDHLRKWHPEEFKLVTDMNRKELERKKANISSISHGP